MVKKLTKQQVQRYKRHRLIIGSGIALLGLAFAATMYFTVVPSLQNNARKERIEAIYSSLELDDSYIMQFRDVFGEKKPYDYDQGRSVSSQISYTRGADVDATYADLDKKAAAAGFTLFDKPYNGGQHHYKSTDGEYLRISVDSKSRSDAFQNVYLMGKDIPESLYQLDKNAGPSNVIIKVNLDDNNE